MTTRCRHQQITAEKGEAHGKTRLTCADCGLSKQRMATDDEAAQWWPAVAEVRAQQRAEKLAAREASDRAEAERAQAASEVKHGAT